MIKRYSAMPLVLALLGQAPMVSAEARADTVVTQQSYNRAETDRSFANFAKNAGGVNRFFKIRKPTPLDQQTVVRMNRDTMYAAATIDTSKGATITIPPIPKGRYFSVLLIDNDHFTPGTIYTSGTHKLPQGTKYLAALVRIQLLKPNDPAEVALINKLQDQFVITAGSADPLPPSKWDKASLAKLTAGYNAKFAGYDRYPDTFMGPPNAPGTGLRHLATAGAWGLFPNKDAVYINYNPKLPATGCYAATYTQPENGAFWSITMYGADGYMKSDNSVLNLSNRKTQPDGRVKVYFGSRAACGAMPNRIDIADGWNFLMRVYRPGKSVLNGSYKLPAVKAVKAVKA